MTFAEILALPPQPNRDSWVWSRYYATGDRLMRHITKAKAEGRDYAEGLALLRDLKALVDEHLAEWQPHHRPN